MRSCLLVVALLFHSLATRAADPVRLIFDTDMANDCDDAGALAVLHALADLGEVEILAIVTNRKDPSNASRGRRAGAESACCGLLWPCSILTC